MLNIKTERYDEGTALFYILNRHAFVRSCQWQELLCIRKVWLGADSADNEGF